MQNRHQYSFVPTLSHRNHRISTMCARWFREHRCRGAGGASIQRYCSEKTLRHEPRDRTFRCSILCTCARPKPPCNCTYLSVCKQTLNLLHTHTLFTPLRKSERRATQSGRFLAREQARQLAGPARAATGRAGRDEGVSGGALGHRHVARAHAVGSEGAQPAGDARHLASHRPADVPQGYFCSR
jgi:hypothetical protein